MPQWGDILSGIKQNKLGYTQMLRAVAESGDMQAEWSAKRHACSSNRAALRHERRKLISRINGIGRRLWQRASLAPPVGKDRGAWCHDLFHV